MGTVFFGWLGTQAAPAANAQAPTVRAALSTAGVTGADQQRIVEAGVACLRDRLGAKDPDVVPASCAAAPPTPALAAAGQRAVRADFTAGMRRTTWLTAGLIALTFLLGFLLPRTARPESAGGIEH